MKYAIMFFLCAKTVQLLAMQDAADQRPPIQVLRPIPVHASMVHASMVDANVVVAPSESTVPSLIRPATRLMDNTVFYRTDPATKKRRLLCEDACEGPSDNPVDTALECHYCQPKTKCRFGATWTSENPNIQRVLDKFLEILPALENPEIEIHPNVIKPDKYGGCLPFELLAHDKVSAFHALIMAWPQLIDITRLKDWWCTRKEDTLLHAVSRRGEGSMERETMHVLLAHKAKVNARNNDGDTPLHIAIQNKRNRWIAILLEHGANPLIENNNSESAIALARKLGLASEIITQLEQHARS